MTPMREFFKDCLRDLKNLTGLDQLHWMEQRCETQEDFDKEKEVLYGGMLHVSEKFGYIQDIDQQKYIKRMMIEDQEYQELNARTIWKWLDLHKDKHITHSQFTEQELSQEIVSPEKADEYLRIILENISKIGNRAPVNGMKQLRESKGYKEGVIARDPRPKWIVGENCKTCDGKGYYLVKEGDLEMKEPCNNCDLTGKEQPRYEVYAASQEEADKAYRIYQEPF